MTAVTWRRGRRTVFHISPKSDGIFREASIKVCIPICFWGSKGEPASTQVSRQRQGWWRVDEPMALRESAVSSGVATAGRK